MALALHLRQQFDTDRADISILAALTVNIIRQVAVEQLPDTLTLAHISFLSEQRATNFEPIIIFVPSSKISFKDLTEMPLTQTLSIKQIKETTK